MPCSGELLHLPFGSAGPVCQDDSLQATTSIHINYIQSCTQAAQGLDIFPKPTFGQQLPLSMMELLAWLALLINRK